MEIFSLAFAKNFDQKQTGMTFPGKTLAQLAQVSQSDGDRSSATNPTKRSENHQRFEGKTKLCGGNSNFLEM